MATGLTKKQKEALTDKITGLIRSGPALRMTTDSSVNEMNINQISGELNRIHYRAIGKDLPTEINIPVKQLGSGDPSPDNIRPIVGYEIDGIGTIYGGDLNIETGVLTVTYGLVDLGTLNWVYITESRWKCFYARIVLKKPGLDNIICEKYPAGFVYNTDIDKIVAGNVNSNNIYIRDLSYTDATTFKTSLSGVMLSYELNTPETYTLTPQQMLQLLDQI